MLGSSRGTSTPSLSHPCSGDPSFHATRPVGRARRDKSLSSQACTPDESYGTAMEYFQHQLIRPLSYNLSSVWYQPCKSCPGLGCCPFPALGSTSGCKGWRWGVLFNLVWEGEGDNPHPKAKARSCWYAAGKGSKTRSRERSRLQRAGPAHEEGSTDVDLDP